MRQNNDKFIPDEKFYLIVVITASITKGKFKLMFVMMML